MAIDGTVGFKVNRNKYSLFSPSANLLDFVGILQRFTYQTVVAGGFAVDTFFVLR